MLARRRSALLSDVGVYCLKLKFRALPFLVYDCEVKISSFLAGCRKGSERTATRKRSNASTSSLRTARAWRLVLICRPARTGLREHESAAHKTGLAASSRSPLSPRPAQARLALPTRALRAVQPVEHAQRSYRVPRTRSRLCRDALSLRALIAALFPHLDRPAPCPAVAPPQGTQQLRESHEHG